MDWQLLACPLSGPLWVRVETRWLVVYSAGLTNKHRPTGYRSSFSTTLPLGWARLARHSAWCVLVQRETLPPTVDDATTSPFGWIST